MKKLILTLFIFITVFSSCSNDENSKTIDSSKIATVLKEKNYDSQKLMYKMLSKEEKREIWVNKIDKLLLNTNLNSRQIYLLDDLKNHLDINLFDNKSVNDEREVFKTIYVKDFLNNAETQFSYEYIYDNFFTISGDIGSSKLYNPIPICSCNQGSIWSCALGVSECRATNKCRSDTDGCGFAGMFECNGNCFNN